MFCITLDPNHYETIKKFGYTPVGLGIKDGLSKLDKTYDPSNFLYTKTYGQAPQNVTITVDYLVGGGLKANVNSNTITDTNMLSSNKDNVAISK